MVRSEGEYRGNIGGISEKKLLEIWTILSGTRLLSVKSVIFVANYVILAGRTDKLTFVLQETGCGTVIELYKANA